MALTRTEIEILIKARDEAKGTFDNLNTVVKNVGKSSEDSGRGLDRLGQGARGAGAGAIAAGVALGNLAGVVARNLVSGFRDTIQAANRLDAGLIGLSSVATAFGQDAEKAKAAAADLAKDGLLSVGDAATALKNLLAAGFGLDQAIELVKRFKDTAAFGKQAALSFGQAVTSATEGIKNGNSILVDNAGVTKNLSNILVEAGFSATDLSKATSDASIRQAIFNGIVKEAKPQMGDAARLLETAAGQQARFAAQTEIASQKIGKQLQPALGALLGILTPIVQTVGDHAKAFTILGTAAAAIVTPIVALGAASRLTGTDVTGLVVQILRAPVGLQGVKNAISGVSSGLIDLARNLTTGQIAFGAITAAAVIATKVFVDYKQRQAEAALSAEVNAAKQDVINKALAAGIDVHGDYAKAVDVVNKLEDIRKARFDKSTEAQLKAVQAQIDLNAATEATLGPIRDQLQAELDANAIREKRVALADVVAASENKIKAEIDATGFSLSELVGQLKNNETGFNAWAKQVGLSDETVKKVNDTLKANEKAQEQAKQAAEKHTQEIEQQRQALEQLGIVTGTSVKTALSDYATLEKRATDEGVPLQRVLIALIPKYEELYRQAKQSGVGVDEATAALARARGAATALVASFPQIPTVGLEKVNELLPQTTAAAEIARTEQERLNAAYKTFGIETPQNLRKAADAAQRNFQILKDSGTATTAQLKDAYNKMIDAQVSASGRLPSVWRTDIFPGISSVLGQLNTAAEGTFAQMLLGAKGFKDGFLDIWGSLKASATKILESLLSFFVNSFLKGMLGALSGQRGAFSSAFSGLFGGGGGGVFGGGGGGGGGILGGLFGGGGGLSPFGGGGPGDQGPLQAGAAGGLAGNLARFGGGGLLAASGLFQLLNAKGKGANTLAGLQTGAGIGTLIAPGIGTLIGGGIGAAAGFVKGLFGGPSKDELAGRDLVGQFEEQLKGLLTTENKLEAGGEAWKQTVIAVREQYLKAGHSADEALQAVDTLWASSKGGAEGAQTAIEQILAVFAEVDEQAKDTADTVEKENTDSAEGAADAFDKAVLDIKVALGQLGPEAASVRNRVENILGGLRFSIPVSYDVQNPPEAPAGAAPEEPALPGAAKGIYASGSRGVATFFGEGGEPEVGGPASFFKQIFESIGVGNGGTGGRGGPVNITMNVYAQQVDRQTVRRDVIPELIDAVSGNKAGARTNLRSALGTA